MTYHGSRFTARAAFACSGLLVLGLPAGCQTGDTPADGFPRKPIKVIVPFDAGGGSDTFTRVLQNAIDQQSLVAQPLVVINVPGASGTIGSRRVKNARPDGYTLLQLHDGILTSKYSGNAKYGPEAFEPIAGTGSMPHVITVSDESPFRDLQGLLEAAAKSPDTIVFAVGIGAPSHFAGLMLEQASPDAVFRFVQSGGGAKRFASLLGGHTQVTTFSLAEYVDFRSSGLRALAILSDRRHARAPEIPTATEQGIPVVSTNMHFWWAPKGTPDDRIAVMADVIRRAMQSPEVQSRLDDMLTEPVCLLGDPLLAELEERENQTAAVAQPDSDESLPDFPWMVACACLTLGGVAALQPRTAPSGDSARNKQIAPPAERFSRRLRMLAVIGLTLSYVGSMQLELLGFRLATFLFILASGAALAAPRPKRLLGLAGVAVLLSLGLHVLFTQLFVIDLP